MRGNTVYHSASVSEAAHVLNFREPIKFTWDPRLGTRHYEGRYATSAILAQEIIFSANESQWSAGTISNH